MNKFYIILFCLLTSFINKCSQADTSYIKFINSQQCQEKILSLDTLIQALDLIVKSDRSGYLVKENKKIFLCVWDNPKGAPTSIFPLYKGTLILESTKEKDSFATFLTSKEKLSQINFSIEKGPIFRSIKIDPSKDVNIKKLLKLIPEIQLIVQL